MHRWRDGDCDGRGGAITVSIAGRALDDIIAHARDAAPSECCGVLVGVATAITAAVPTRNLADDPNRFLVDPKQHIEARRAARARGLEVVGFYHSHPHSPPVPSPTDWAEASYPDLLYLIARPDLDPPEVRVFRLENGQFLEMPLVTVP